TRRRLGCAGRPTGRGPGEANSQGAPEARRWIPSYGGSLGGRYRVGWDHGRNLPVPKVGATAADTRPGGGMSFLLDTDTCSAHMRLPAKLAHRFIQYTGQLAIASVTLAELYAGAYKHSQTNRLLALIADLLQEVRVVDFDAACAEKFGQVRGTLLRQGI